MTPQLLLEDLLAELTYARRRGDLGRLALIAWCEVRRWARQAGHAGLAELSETMFADQPHASREAFLLQVDRLIDELSLLQAARAGQPRSERAAPRQPEGSSMHPAPTPAPARPGRQASQRDGA